VIQTKLTFINKKVRFFNSDFDIKRIKSVTPITFGIELKQSELPIAWKIENNKLFNGSNEYACDQVKGFVNKPVVDFKQNVWFYCITNNDDTVFTKLEKLQNFTHAFFYKDTISTLGMTATTKETFWLDSTTISTGYFARGESYNDSIYSRYQKFMPFTLHHHIALTVDSMTVNTNFRGTLPIHVNILSDGNDTIKAKVISNTGVAIIYRICSNAELDNSFFYFMNLKENINQLTVEFSSDVFSSNTTKSGNKDTLHLRINYLNNILISSLHNKVKNLDTIIAYEKTVFIDTMKVSNITRESVLISQLKPSWLTITNSDSLFIFKGTIPDLRNDTTIAISFTITDTANFMYDTTVLNCSRKVWPDSATRNTRSSSFTYYVKILSNHVPIISNKETIVMTDLYDTIQFVLKTTDIDNDHLTYGFINDRHYISNIDSLYTIVSKVSGLDTLTLTVTDKDETVQYKLILDVQNKTTAIVNTKSVRDYVSVNNNNIKFGLSKPSKVSIQVFDLNGQIITNIHENRMTGNHSISFNCSNKYVVYQININDKHLSNKLFVR
jgi:hypothetical protein